MNRATAVANKSRTDSVHLYPSHLAHKEAENFYPHINNSALRMRAEQVLKRAKMNLPLHNRAACVAVIRGITGTAVRKGQSTRGR